MKKQIFSIVLLLFFINNIGAQGNYYFANYQRQYWREDSTSINIIVANMQNYNLIVRNLQTVFSANNDTVRYGNDDDNIIIISDRLKTMDLSQILSTISPTPTDILFVSYAKKVDNRRIWLRNETYVKLKNDTSYYSYLLPFLSQFNDYLLEYDNEVEDYKITCDKEADMLQIANGLYDTQYVYYSSPDFYCEMNLNTTDPKYEYQWSLNNVGQENGTAGVDINAEKAWEFLLHYNNNLGDSVRVAVIDAGVESHEDLNDASGNSRVKKGYPSWWGQGAPYDSYQYHGQACAGIIAASHNSVGIAGIAPNSLIVPIRIQRDTNTFFSAKRIQKAITKAWKTYNAQILSNSWGGNYNDFITDGFQKAMQEGRDGRGCVVVIASGNKCRPYVEFPASITGVIAVGATDRCGQRASNGTCENVCEEWGSEDTDPGSSYGAKLSVVAPGTHIYTIDRMGNAGLLPGNYNSNFNGTSAACPHVAGVSALILSINPDLTHGQVKEIIEKTAQKVGSYNYEINNAHPNGKWNEKMGYGMVDAYRALAFAKIYGNEYSIAGPSSMQLCNEYTYTLLGNVPEGYDIVWETNLLLCVVSGQGTPSLIVRPLYPASGNRIKVKICFDGEVIKEIETDYIVSTGTGIYPITNHDSVINSNVTWTYERSLGNTITIDSGIVLTITSTIHCTDNARLIVRPGGKLVIDGGTLTSACDGELWQGIEVVGDRTKHQLAQYQGIVELRNGATIENAHCAIRTGLAGGAGYATAGGIIRAEDAHFVNNRRSVEFISYMDTLAGGSLGDNVSRFQNTEFIVDDQNLFAANNCGFIDHVTLWQVKGVEFEGCEFKNQTSGTSDRRHAVYAEDAGFSVTTYCEQHASSQPECECPEEYATHCAFSGFANAVEVNTTGEQYPVTLDEARFSNNGTGIKVNGNNFATVTRCRFNLDQTPVHDYSNTGLVLAGCSGYKVEENHFERTTYPSGPFLIENSIGITVSNSGFSDNSLYRNSFINLTRGISVSGENGHRKFGTGLQLTCNYFNGNKYDIYLASGATVSYRQGNPSKGADNEFHNTANNVSNFYNPGLFNINYCYYNGDMTLYPVNHTGLSFSPLSTSNTCPSTLCGGVPDPGPVTSFAAQMSAYTSALADYYDNLDNLGNTNPQTQPAEMRQSLSETYYAAVRALMSDTTLDLAALEQWHTAAQPIADPYSLTETRFMEGYAEPFVADADDAEMANYAEFHAMKLALRNNGAGNDGTVETQNFASLQPGGHVNWYALTPAQIAQLQTIAERNTGRASVMAKGVLCFFFGICYEDGGNATSETDPSAETRAKHTAADIADETALTVYPNPTDDLLFVELRGAGIANVALYDLQGRAVETLRATSLQDGTATLDVKSLPAGVYVLRVKDAEGREYQQKVVRK